MRTALIIARFTLQEAVSRRLILAGLLLSAGFVALFALGFTFAYTEVGSEAGPVERVASELGMVTSILTLLGLYAVYVLSSVLALFVSVGAVSGEIDAGTIHALLARPIRRSQFLVGRWLAYVVLVGTYVVAMAGSVLLVARAVAGFELAAPLPGIALMVFGAVLLLTLSLLGSTVFSTMANGVVVFTLFGLAWIGGFIEWVGNVARNPAMVNLGITVSLLVPSDALWRGASFFVQSPLMLSQRAGSVGALPFAGGAPPTESMLVWSLGYVALALAGATFVFSRRDV